MQLYSRSSKRLYLNASERRRFCHVANQQALHIKVFALTLLFTGCRLSEARELRKHSIQFDEQIISIRSLKKRTRHHIREIPAPPELIIDLVRLAQTIPSDALLWEVDRITAYRWIKGIMSSAMIVGPQGCPKGLRHSFGIHAIGSGVQLNMLQKWMGHASIKTTSVYANAVGKEERAVAEKMWH